MSVTNGDKTEHFFLGAQAITTKFLRKCTIFLIKAEKTTFGGSDDIPFPQI